MTYSSESSQAMTTGQSSCVSGHSATTSSISNTCPNRQLFGRLSGASPSSSFLLFALSASLLVLAIIGPSIVVDAKPMDVFPAYQTRSNAIKALKDLDHYASQHARPRFGKRFGNEKMTAVAGETSRAANFGDAPGNQDFPLTDPLMGSIIGDRWILINRNRPLTKLTESYLREILAENERLRELQNGAEQESILMGSSK